MALKKKLIFLWTLVLYLVARRLPKAFGKVPVPRVPTITDPKFITAFVDIHNELRRKVHPPSSDMNHLTWDPLLAKVAKAWTRECKFSHNPCTSKRYGCLQDYDFIGENIYLGVLDTRPEDVVTSWYNESMDYNYEHNTCLKTCGHYTQTWKHCSRLFGLYNQSPTPRSPNQAIPFPGASSLLRIRCIFFH
ncbi:GLIPR1-like protein 1 isoform X2 [Arvicanthis niloticus]|uniref:GLIPR1-like protein 1 isoform X2 n=1 Tax=Arvicanthis niloticus TaxID=61156 RepID=UPI00402BAF6A